jgi:hypothetical protein
MFVVLLWEVADWEEGNILSLRLRLHDGLRQSGGAFGAAFFVGLKPHANPKGKGNGKDNGKGNGKDRGRGNDSVASPFRLRSGLRQIGGAFGAAFSWG